MDVVAKKWRNHSGRTPHNSLFLSIALFRALLHKISIISCYIERLPIVRMEFDISTPGDHNGIGGTYLQTMKQQA